MIKKFVEAFKKYALPVFLGIVDAAGLAFIIYWIVAQQATIAENSILFAVIVVITGFSIGISFFYVWFAYKTAKAKRKREEERSRHE